MCVRVLLLFALNMCVGVVYCVMFYGVCFFFFLCLCVSVCSFLNNVFVCFCDSLHDLALFVFVVRV